MIDLKFTEELESIFRSSFLASAKLYREASKIKLPFEDAKKVTTLYRGSLTEETRPVETIADYKLWKAGYPGDDTVRGTVDKFGTEAGIVVDGLIRLENTKNHADNDSRNTSALKVTDIFNHFDGRSNLNLFVRKDDLNSFAGYRFYFAAASIKMEYRPATSCPA